MLDTAPQLTTAPFAGANTFGWDTVFGITFDRVNQAIAKEGSFPPDFAHADPSGDSLSGSFSAWALTGGSGPKLHVTLSVPELELVQGTPLLRRQVSIIIEAELDKFPATPGLGHAAGASALAFRIATANLADEPVKVLGLTYPALPPDGPFPGQPASADDALTPTDIQNLFFDWINVAANLGKFTATFATVNLNSRAAVDAWKWLDPSFATYAVQKTGGDGGGVFAVMCMTGGRAQPVSWEVTADLIPEGSQAGFLMSKEMFLANMLLPGLGLMFDDPGVSGKAWPQGYFRLTEGGSRIENTAPLGIARFEIEGKEYNATLATGGFSAKLEDTYLVLDLQRFAHPFAGFWYDVFHEITLPCTIALDEGRKQLLLCPGSGEYDPDGHDLNPPAHNATIQKTAAAQGIEWTIAVIDLLLILYHVGKLASAVCQTTTTQVGAQVAEGAAQVPLAAPQALEGGLNIAAGGAPLVAEGLAGAQQAAQWGARAYASAFFAVVGAMAGFENLAQWILNQAEAGKATIPDIGIFAAKVMEPVTWPDAAGFALDSVQFNGGVQMGGTPVFADTAA